MSETAIEAMIVTYHEHNGVIDELHEDPTPLEFMRYVSKAQPFVVRGGCSAWRAIKRWNIAYFRQIMSDMPVKVANTPHGLVQYETWHILVATAKELKTLSNADSAVVNASDGLTYFVKPFETIEAFSEFLSHLLNKNLDWAGGRVRYSQTRTARMKGIHNFRALNTSCARERQPSGRIHVPVRRRGARH